jgi:hypothetical protein
MKATEKLTQLITDNGGKLVLEKNINFYGENISGKVTRIEKKDDEFYALVDSDGYLFSEIIPKNKITDSFISNVEQNIKK